MPGMGEVNLEIVLKRVEDVLAGQDAIRAELAALNETVRSLARSNVSIQRDVAALKDRMNILAVAVDEHPPAHV
jgi:hypothetical protein